MPAFGLAPEQISVYDPKTRQIHWQELRKRGVEFSGLVVARTAVKKSLNNVAAKVIDKASHKIHSAGWSAGGRKSGLFCHEKNCRCSCARLLSHR